MKTLIFCMLVAFGLTLGGGSLQAETTREHAAQYETRLDELSKQTQAQIEVLSEQLATVTDAAATEELNRQIQNLKHSAEVSRLEILLEWATAENDAERIAEVQAALNHWQNPAQPQDLPEINRDANLHPEKPAAEGQNNR